MKKLLIIIFILMLGISPVLVTAEEKEVNYKWYKEIETNIRYEKDAENICEYFDKSSNTVSDWYYTTTKPEEKDYRIIEEVDLDLEISRMHTKSIEILSLGTNYAEVYEIEMFDSQNNKIDYNFKTETLHNKSLNLLNDGNFDDFVYFSSLEKVRINLDEIINTKDLVVKIYHSKDTQVKYLYIVTYLSDEIKNNAFDDYEEIITTNCDEEICVTEIKYDETRMFNKPIIMNTKGFRYKDTYYKCFDIIKDYTNEYYKDLTKEGYIKDENDFIVIEKVTNANQNNISENISSYCETPYYIQNAVERENIPMIEENENDDKVNYDNTSITEEVTNKVENILKKGQIAMVSKEEAKEEMPEYLTFFTVFIILSIILTIIIISKKIKNCRMK